MKYIDVGYQFVWEIISEECILHQKINIFESVANILTKVVTTIKFNICLDLINIAKV